MVNLQSSFTFNLQIVNILSNSNKSSPNIVAIALWASGNGSLAQSIFEYFNHADSNIKIGVLLCNKAQALVLEKATNANIPTVLINPNDADEILKTLIKYQIQFNVLAGYLKKVPLAVLNAYPNKVINIHPALLPDFGGKGMYGNHVHQAVVAAGSTQSGFTVHYVNEVYDDGEIIFQMKTDIFPNTTVDDLQQQIQALERQYYPPLIRIITESLSSN